MNLRFTRGNYKVIGIHWSSVFYYYDHGQDLFLNLHQKEVRKTATVLVLARQSGIYLGFEGFKKGRKIGRMIIRERSQKKTLEERQN